MKALCSVWCGDQGTSAAIPASKWHSARTSHLSLRGGGLWALSVAANSVSLSPSRSGPALRPDSRTSGPHVQGPGWPRHVGPSVPGGSVSPGYGSRVPHSHCRNEVHKRRHQALEPSS